MKNKGNVNTVKKATNKATDQGNKTTWSRLLTSKATKLVDSIIEANDTSKIRALMIRGEKDRIQNKVQESKTVNKEKTFLFPTYQSRIDYYGKCTEKDVVKITKLTTIDLIDLLAIASKSGKVDMHDAFKAAQAGYRSMLAFATSKGILNVEDYDTSESDE